MHFIFPRNYKFKNKLFGFMDYTTAIINIVWWFFIYKILNIFPFYFSVKITIFIVLSVPLFLFSLLGFNNENIIYFFYYIFKFLKNRRVYFFSK